MKRKMKIGIVSDYVPIPEEYRMFRNQPERVLACYSLAKRCMAVIMPLSALAAVYSPLFALGLSCAGGITGFLLLRRKHGVKGALVPLICSLAGVLIGLYVAAPMFSHARVLKEAYRGI
jgi:hypothetical protein